jgi:hypothetical protein
MSKEDFSGRMKFMEVVREYQYAFICYRDGKSRFNAKSLLIKEYMRINIVPSTDVSTSISYWAGVLGTKRAQP